MHRITDYRSRIVRLTDERLAHIIEHPEMRGMEAAIEETLRRPRTVIRSRTDPDVNLYYGPRRATRVGDMYVCVVVKVTGDPFVITAYLTDRPKKGEPVWSAEP
jgi:hypothetical protein